MNKNDNKIKNENFQKNVLYVKHLANATPQLKISNRYLDFWLKKLNFFLQHDG